MSTEIGRFWEKSAARYLEEKGYEMLAYNFSCSYGEIDLIALDKARFELVFVEVKYRRKDECGNSYEFVDERKIHRLEKTIQYFLMCHDTDEVGEMDYRLDVIAITPELAHDGREKMVFSHFENVSF